MAAGRTPKPTGGENVDTMTYPVPATKQVGGGGTANAQTGRVPEVVVGGSSESMPAPAMPGTLRIGDDKNVSTPVTG